MPPKQQWNVLVWNIRGINSNDKLLAIRNAIETCGCDVICLQETKRMHFDLAFLKTFCPKRFDNFAYVPSRGASGGIITIWSGSAFSGSVCYSENHALGVTLTSKVSGNVWSLYNIYGPCQGNDHVLFTDWLYDLDIPDSDDWLLVGDFNFIRSSANRNKPVTQMTF